MTEKADGALEVDIITPMGVIDQGQAGFVSAMGAVPPETVALPSTDVLPPGPGSASP